MDYGLPFEIWHQIFTSACLDGGATGRALSYVCRRFYTISQETKFQSIVVVGVAKVMRLSAVLNATEPKHRQVKYLCLSDSSVEESQQLRRDEYDSFLQAYIDLLSSVAPTILSIYVSHTLARHTFLFPFSMPFLQKLIINGPYVPTEEANECVYPSLRYLQLIGCNNYSVNFLQLFSVQTPNLTHLYFSATYLPRYFPYDLNFALLPKGKGLPATIQRVVIESGWEAGPWVDHSGRLLMDKLKAISRRDRRVVVSKSPIDYQQVQTAQNVWLEHILCTYACDHDHFKEI